MKLVKGYMCSLIYEPIENLQLFCRFNFFLEKFRGKVMCCHGTHKLLYMPHLSLNKTTEQNAEPPELWREPVLT